MANTLTDFTPAAERLTLQMHGGAVAGWRWPSPGDTQLVFLHATGFCASAYRPVFELARRQFDIFAIDLRGHGRTTLPADPSTLRSWSLYAADVAAALDALPTPQRGRILSGHSCGAVVAALAACGRKDVKRLALIEPVAMPSWMRHAAATPVWPLTVSRWPLVRGAKSRRAKFPSREAAAQNYGRKPLFARWTPDSLKGYLEDGLAEAENGVRLACTPDWEAATFAAQAHDFWGAVRRAPCSVHVLIARDPSSTVSRRAENRLNALGAQVTIREGVSHLLPLEDPEAAAAFLCAADRSD